MKTRLIALSALAMVVAGGATAGEPRGVYRFEYLDTFSTYVPCLGATVAGPVHTVAWVQFYPPQPSGARHMMFHFQDEMELQDQYGNSWIGHSDGSWVGNMRNGESTRYVAQMVFKPVFGDGPMWLLQTNSKLTINANGEPVVDRPGLDWEEAARCLPSTTK